MGKRSIQKSDYDAMVRAFRADAPKYRKAEVGRKCGVDPKTADRAWTLGFPRKQWKPIKEIMQGERVTAQDLIVKEQHARQANEAKQRMESETAAIAATVAESKLVSLARSSALQGMIAGATLTTQARAVADVVRQRLSDQCKLSSTDQHHMTAAAGIAYLDKLVNIQTKLQALGHQAMVMDRLSRGQPGEISAVAVGTDMTMEEATTRIDAANQALNRAKASGGLKVLDGGLEAPILGKVVTMV